MIIGAVIAVCVLLLILAFVFPRLSRHPQRGAQRTMGVGAQVGGKAPGPIGRLLSTSFGKSSQAMGKSASAGRKGRGKLPL